MTSSPAFLIWRPLSDSMLAITNWLSTMPLSMTFFLTKAEQAISILMSMWLHAGLHRHISDRVLIAVSAYLLCDRCFDIVFQLDAFHCSLLILDAVTEPDKQLTDFLRLFLPDPKPFQKGDIRASGLEWHFMRTLSSLVCRSLTFFLMHDDLCWP